MWESYVIIVDVAEARINFFAAAQRSNGKLDWFVHVNFSFQCGVSILHKECDVITYGAPERPAQQSRWVRISSNSSSTR